MPIKPNVSVKTNTTEVTMSKARETETWLSPQIGTDEQNDHIYSIVNKFMKTAIIKLRIKERVLSQPSFLSILSLLLWYVAIFAIYYLNPTLPKCSRSNCTFHCLRFQILRLAINLPKLLLHQLHLHLMFMRIIHHQITYLHPNHKSHKTHQVWLEHSRSVQLRYSRWLYLTHRIIPHLYYYYSSGSEYHVERWQREKQLKDLCLWRYEEIEQLLYLQSWWTQVSAN